MFIPVIAVVLNWRNEKNVSGLFSIHLRITINRESKYHRINLPKKVRKKDWSGTEGAWVRPSHPFYFEINNKIIEAKNQVYDLIRRHYAFNKNIDFDIIFSDLQKKGDKNCFYQFMEAYIKRPPEKLEPNTIKKYNTTLIHLKKFKKNIHFPDIDNNLLRDFTRFMQVDLSLGGAAVKKYLEAFKKVIRQARRENYISPTQMEFLFDGLKVKVPKAKRVFLDPSEIKKWKEAKISADMPHLIRDRDLYLFQIYTGYYYKDLFIFEKSQLVADREYGTVIIGERDKNGNQTIIPLYKFPYAQTIIEKYRSKGNEAGIFDKKYLVEEQTYNENLKEIAKIAEIGKNVTNKVARHTNAQLWVRYGAERPVLSKMLGHTKEETTRNYYDVNLPEIYEGTKRVDFSTLGI